MISEDKTKFIHIKDKKRKVNIEVDFEIEGNVWGYPVYTKTGTGKKVEDLYQCDCLLPHWPISIAPGKSWTNSIQLRLDRRAKRVD